MKSCRVCVTLLLAAMFSCAVMPQKQSVASVDAPEYFANDSLRAIYFYTEGVRIAAQNDDKEAAAAMFERAIAIDSLFAPALYSLADAYMLSAPERALGYSLRANAIDSLNLEYRGQLAYLKVLGGDYRSALELYNRLLRDDPRNPLNHKAVAILYNASGMPFTAIGILDSAEYKLGRIEDLVEFKRELLIGVKLYDRAIEETRASIVDNPFDNDSYRILGELYGLMGRDSLALANLETARRLDSSNPKTLFSLAEYYEKKGRENEQIGVLRQIFANSAVDFATKRDIFERLTSDIDFYRRNYFAIGTLASTLITYYPDDYEAVDIYISHLIRMGEIERALTTTKEFAASHNDVKPYFAILDIESYLGRPDSVRLYADKAIARFADNSELYLRKGYALQTVGAPLSEAEKTYRKAVEFAADSVAESSALGVLGDLYHTYGRHRKAFATYRKALRINADNSVVLNNYAYYLSELGERLGEALEMSARACRLTPSNPTYLDTQAWILHLLGRNDEAKRLMQQAISLDSSGNATLLVHYGDILAALGENFMAKTYWERARKAGYGAALIDERLKSLTEQ